MPLDISIDIFLVYFASGYMYSTAQFFFFFLLTYFFLFFWGIIMSRCADANPIYVLNIANSNLWHSWLRTLLKMTCSPSLLERSRSFDFKWKRKQLPLWDISTGYLYGISSLALFLANGADQFFWFCAVFSLRFYTKNNLGERSDCNQMFILMMLFLLPDLDIPRCNCNSE